MTSLYDAVPACNDAGAGEARCDKSLSLLRTHRAALVRDMTRAAVLIALDRGELTADDVRAIVPIPPDIRPIVAGAAIRDAADTGILRLIGYRPSTRPAALARLLSVWTLADADAALAWLAAHPPITAD